MGSQIWSRISSERLVGNANLHISCINARHMGLICSGICSHFSRGNSYKLNFEKNSLSRIQLSDDSEFCNSEITMSGSKGWSPEN